MWQKSDSYIWTRSSAGSLSKWQDGELSASISVGGDILLESRWTALGFEKLCGDSEGRVRRERSYHYMLDGLRVTKGRNVTSRLFKRL